MQVQQLLKIGAAALAKAGVDESELTAELLLRGCLGVSRSRLFLLHDQQVTRIREQRFYAFVNRRCEREPLQYILGSCEFWSLDFYVSPAVLIPRPETEFLLEHVITTLELDKEAAQPLVLDLCTGSGVIAVVLAREFPHACVIAADCSAAALEQAGKNVVCHGLTDRISLICADLLSPFAEEQVFDLIVSNPPYVLAGDLAGLAPEVREWEPELALSGGEKGMDVIVRICRQAADHLKVGGWLFMEIGADIEGPVLAVFSQSDRYEQVRVVRDWAGRPRVLQAKCAG